VAHRRAVRQERERSHQALEAAYCELEQAHTHLKATQAQLVQAEKMASLGELTAGIAHEIKNPLNFINNFSEVNEELAQELREAYEADPDIKLADLLDLVTDLEQNAAIINQHGKRADGIVSAMMQHASGGTGKRESTDVNALLEEYVNLAYHGKRAQIEGFNCEIQRAYDEAIGNVEMIPQNIGRVFLNLLSNAFDAVHEKARSVDGDYEPTVRVQTQRTNADGTSVEAIAIRIQDNGPGIPQHFREKIFEPFFTTKPTGSGTGLGLSLSYDIITKGHGGTLEVESTEGDGATFIITLPA
jgi:signal transduction histidine kinase